MKLAMVIAFLVGAAAPPLGVWIATRGPGHSDPVRSEALGGAESARQAQRARLSIDEAIDRYLEAHGVAPK